MGLIILVQVGRVHLETGAFGFGFGETGEARRDDGEMVKRDDGENRRRNDDEKTRPRRRRSIPLCAISIASSVVLSQLRTDIDDAPKRDAGFDDASTKLEQDDETSKTNKNICGTSIFSHIGTRLSLLSAHGASLRSRVPDELNPVVLFFPTYVGHISAPNFLPEIFSGWNTFTGQEKSGSRSTYVGPMSDICRVFIPGEGPSANN
ncbi:hypothetical protein C8J56DRAFT_905764 [Mycena floridula]|nr:hypothetical protein C8J56DRAFT_905764 [Mycena floridula]